MKKLLMTGAAVAAIAGFAGTAELKNGQEFSFENLPEEMTV